MKTECPICGQKRNQANESAGTQVECRTCETSFEVRSVPSAVDLEEANETRQLIFTVIVPIIVCTMILLCGVCAEVLHRRHNDFQIANSAPAASGIPTTPNHRRAPRPVIPRPRLGTPRTAPPQVTTLPAPVAPPMRPPETIQHRPPRSGTEFRDPTPVELISVSITDDARDPLPPSVPDRPLARYLKGGAAFYLSDVGGRKWVYKSPLLVGDSANSGQAEIYARPGELPVSCIHGGVVSAAIGTASGDLEWYALGKRRSIRERHAGPVLGVSSSSSTLWSCSTDGTLLRNTSSGRQLTRWKLPAKPVSCVFDRSGRSLVIGCEDRRILLSRDVSRDDWSSFRARGPAQCLAITDYFIAVGGGHQIEVRGRKQFDLWQVFETPFEVTAIALDFRGEVVFAGGRNGDVVCYSVYSRRAFGTTHVGEEVVALNQPLGGQGLRIGLASGKFLSDQLLDGMNGAFKRGRPKTPLALRADAAEFEAGAGGGVMNDAVEAGFSAADDVIRLLAAETGRDGHSVKHLERHNNDLVVAFGSGLSTVKRVLLVEAARQTEIPVIKRQAAQVHLQYSPPKNSAPVLLFEFEDSFVVTIPFGTATVSSDRNLSQTNDELHVLRPRKILQTFTDEFRLLVLPATSGVFHEIKGRGVVVAESGSRIPDVVRGVVTVIQCNSHKTSQRSVGRGAALLTADSVHICPIPDIIVSP